MSIHLLYSSLQHARTQRPKTISVFLFVFFLHCTTFHSSTILFVSAQCNGGPDLCQRSYSDITHLVTHDAYAYLAFNPASTQDHPIIEQLNDGVRGLKLSAVPSVLHSDQINLCHTSCLILNAGKAIDTLNIIADWLEVNPTEVVTIMWNNLYYYKADQLAKVYEQSRIMPFIYDQYNASSKTWPTLQQMVDQNKRVVNFIDAEADQDKVPWLIDQFSVIFETPYDYTDPQQFNCEVDRIAGDGDIDTIKKTAATSPHIMYVLNHFLYGALEIGSLKVEVPLRHKASQTNSRQSIMDHVRNCTTIFQRKPAFLEVDFYSMGEALAIVSELNRANNTSAILSVTTAPTTDTAIIMDNGKDSATTLSPTQHVLVDNKARILGPSDCLLLWFITATVFSVIHQIQIKT